MPVVKRPETVAGRSDPDVARCQAGAADRVGRDAAIAGEDGALVLKLPAATGANATFTVWVCPPATVYGLPLVMRNGDAVATAPVKVSSPVLITEKFKLLVWPTVIDP